jgi:hypothetical protein
MAHHGRARDLAERADMRQAGRAVAGLKQHRVGKTGFFVARDDLAGFLEGPGLAFFGFREDFGGRIVRGRGFF